MSPIVVLTPNKLSKMLSYIPPLGIFLDPWLKLERDYRNQLVKRGKIDNEEWRIFEVDMTTKGSIDNILKNRVWGESVCFHPMDPYFIIGDIQCGDLSEYEILMDVENMFNFKYEKDAINKIGDMKYYEFIIDVKRRSNQSLKGRM